MKNTFWGTIAKSVAYGLVISLCFTGYKNSELKNNQPSIKAQEVFDNEIGEITESEEDLEESLLYMEVKASALNVRDDVMGKKISVVHKGDRFYIFGENKGWYLILLNEGQAGWVCGKYVDVYYPSGELFVLASAYTKGDGKPENPVNNQAEVLANAQAEVLAAQQAQQEALLAAQQAQAQALAEQQAQAEALLAAQQEALLAAQQAQAQLQPWQTKEWTSLTNSELIQWAIASCITPGMSQYDMCVAVNNFLCNHMTYDLSYYTTHDALMYGRGRCQGYANAFKDIMNTLGVPTDYVRGYGNSGRHGWNRVNIGGVYYYIDVTWNDSTGSNDWLMISEQQILRDHIITQYSASNTQ